VNRRRAALFLDRDGTIIEDVEYIAKPEDVRLLAGVGAAIAQLNAAGIPVIMVSNQSGIGRGYFTRDDFDRVQARVEERLAAAGAHLDATFICPHAPSDPPACMCRKPATALFEEAATTHDIDLAASWYVGDTWRDVQPGRTLHGHGILIPADSTPQADLDRARSLGLVRTSLADVAREMLAALTGGRSTR
jgi:histidinol-phosphate phosphatase family protein